MINTISRYQLRAVQTYQLLVVVVVGNVAVADFKSPACLVHLALADKPPRCLGEESKDNANSSNHGPLSVNGCPEVVGVGLVERVERHRGKQLANDKPARNGQQLDDISWEARILQ